jgi:formate hydrogenlyase subunit 6/NADH:ubiquinone oxidoreductase subunit I
MDWFLKNADFDSFVGTLSRKKRVIGPVAKQEKFIFAEIKSSKDLRLDYDVTILPPKKAIIPPTQELIEFTGKGFKSAVKPADQVLLGVHFYDVKAIDMLDKIYGEEPTDGSYMEQRKRTTIVASNVQKISPRAFFGSVSAELRPQGHDAFLTKLPAGYLFRTLTPKGEELLKAGKFRKATAEEVKKSEKINAAVMEKCPEKLEYTSKEIARRVRTAFKNEPLWKELSKKCFSCGTCNIVCPTCHCADVQDYWSLDQVSGGRYRTWDGCLLNDFAHITLGAGGFENPREKVSSRYRHRMMRKTTYLNEKLGGPACVGCGRCSAGCVPDIADPVRTIHAIMED